MENPAPFDLNATIRCWRERLHRLPSFQSENADELEAHLRDSVSRLQACGLTDEEAWIIAVKRIGQNDALDREFAKINASFPAWRAITSMMIAIIVGSLFFQADRAFTQKVWRVIILEWGSSVLTASALVVPTFLLIVFPVLALSRKLKWELSWWRAFGLGALICLLAWLLVATVRPGMEIKLLVVMGGPIACGFGAATYAKLKLTPLTARMISGAWIAMGGTSICGLVWLVFGRQLQPWDALHRWENAVSLIVGPILVALSWSLIVFPMGAVLGAWLPRRLKPARPWASFGFGCTVGAGLSTLLLLVGFVTWQTYLLGSGADREQLELMREMAIRALPSRFFSIAPIAALWVGLWAVRWNKKAGARILFS